MPYDEQVQKIQRVVEQETARLAGDPNVLGVGFGIKRRAGNIVEGLSIRYLVRAKLPDQASIQKVGSAPLPREIEGFPTDVIEMEPATADDNGPPTGNRGSRKDDPLVGGGSTTVLSDFHSFPTGFGTLGGVCFDVASGDAMALSNAHVWGMESGKDVIQPWIPTGEYLEGIVKLLACGAVVSYLTEWTAPSPLTVGLGAAAAGAWIAAAASDTEDPNRWGQRVSPAPPAGAATLDERVRLNAPVPERPFPGLVYSTRAYWGYERDTPAGTFSAETTEDRTNEHLVEKRVWTDRSAYQGGQRVTICAELSGNRVSSPDGYFVVAHCFPTDQRERLVSRVLVPGRCAQVPKPEERYCFDGFPRPAAPGTMANFPLVVSAFRVSAPQGSHFSGPWPPSDPGAVTSLQIPSGGLEVRVPPSPEVTLKVYHHARPVIARAYSPVGLVDQTESSMEQGHLQELRLAAPGIERVVIAGGAGEGHLVGMCARGRQVPGAYQGRTFQYQGHLDLSLQEAKARWGVMLFAQTVNNAPPGSDPIAAAQNIGGMTATANVADVAVCTVVLLLDHVFDVI